MFWRGVTRLWIAGSFVWAAVLLWQSDPKCVLLAIGFKIETGPWCDYRDASYYADLAFKMIGWPVLAWGA
jgi:hypothetical protein